MRCGAASVRDLLGPGRSVSPCLGACTFRGWSATTVFVAARCLGWEGEQAPHGVCCYSPPRRAVVGTRDDRVLRGHLALRGSSNGGDRATVPADRSLVIGLGWPGALQGRWRVCRHSTRPVLKHGPRSLTCARVIGRYETQRRSESEGGPGLTQVGSLLFAGGRTTGPSRPRCRWGGAGACTLGPERW